MLYRLRPSVCYIYGLDLCNLLAQLLINLLTLSCNIVCSGVPAVVDFAAMRDAVKKLGGDPGKINPVAPADLVIDHSVQVDVFRRCVCLFVCLYVIFQQY